MTEFRPIRHKLKAPFRLTVKGKIADVQGLETTQSGNEKRLFDIVDNTGAYISCCAMRHNAKSAALQNFQDVVIYHGTGRGAIGSAKGALYLMKDAFIVPIGNPSSSPVIKKKRTCSSTEQSAMNWPNAKSSAVFITIVMLTSS